MLSTCLNHAAIATFVGLSYDFFRFVSRPLINRVLFAIRLPFFSLIGIGIGIGGVALLLYNGHDGSFSISPSVLLLLCALFLWSFATCMSNRLEHYPDVFHR